MTVIMVFAIMTTAFAEETGTGSITINKAITGYEYSIYRIFDLGKYDKTTDAYIYTVNSNWSDFINNEDIKGIYVNVDTNGHVTWVKGASAADFAEKAISHAQANTVAVTGSAKATGETVTFGNLVLGYYLIDSSVGTLCMLDTTDPEVTIDEKNGVPVTEKFVQENSNDTWGEENDADIGMTVNFKTHIHTTPGTENYVLHDKMSEGLTLNESAIVVFYERVIDGKNEKTTLEKGSDYSVSTNCSDDCSFELTFNDEIIKRLGADKVLLNVEYSAVLNENAVVGGKNDLTDPEKRNTNETWLKYNDKNETTHDFTTTYTYKFDLVKTDNEGITLSGAKFKLYNYKADAVAGINAIKFVHSAADNSYRVAKANEEGNDVIEVKDGKATIIGLEGNYGIVSGENTEGYSYWLVETKAPDGYNLLTEPKEIEITNKNELANVFLDAQIKDTEDELKDVKTYNGGGFQVINNSGTILPTTGGMGTTLLYIAGGVLVLVAVVLLITKKRMGSAE